MSNYRNLFTTLIFSVVLIWNFPTIAQDSSDEKSLAASEAERLVDLTFTDGIMNSYEQGFKTIIFSEISKQHCDPS
jgi:hypothetical protein